MAARSRSFPEHTTAAGIEACVIGLERPGPAGIASWVVVFPPDWRWPARPRQSSLINQRRGRRPAEQRALYGIGKRVGRLYSRLTVKTTRAAAGGSGTRHQPAAVASRDTLPLCGNQQPVPIWQVRVMPPRDRGSQARPPGSSPFAWAPGGRCAHRLYGHRLAFPRTAQLRPSVALI